MGKQLINIGWLMENTETIVDVETDDDSHRGHCFGNIWWLFPERFLMGSCLCGVWCYLSLLGKNQYWTQQAGWRHSENWEWQRKWSFLVNKNHLQCHSIKFLSSCFSKTHSLPSLQHSEPSGQWESKPITWLLIAMHKRFCFDAAINSWEPFAYTFIHTIKNDDFQLNPGHPFCPVHYPFHIINITFYNLHS